jgi:protein-disulfide isomerase
VVRQIEDTYLKPGTGKVRFIYRHMAFLGQESIDAAEASECANEQGKFWEYADTLFANQRGENRGAFSLSRLKQFAVDLGLDTAAFNTCLDARRYRSVVEQETQQAQARGVRQTPSIAVNNQLLEGAPDFARLSQMIEQIAGGQ